MEIGNNVLELEGNISRFGNCHHQLVDGVVPGITLVRCIHSETRNES